MMKAYLIYYVLESVSPDGSVDLTHNNEILKTNVLDETLLKNWVKKKIKENYEFYDKEDCISLCIKNIINIDL